MKWTKETKCPDCGITLESRPAKYGTHAMIKCDCGCFVQTSLVSENPNHQIRHESKDTRFKKWLETQEEQLQLIAQSRSVYLAMLWAFEANQGEYMP